MRNWLEHNQNWLFIFDNASKPEDLIKFLPRSSSGHVLITSRHQTWEKLCPSLQINIWTRKESLEFLAKRTKGKIESSAGKVAEALGDLPLALEQAAAYINETGMGFDEYLDLFKKRSKELCDKETSLLGYQDTVPTTLGIAIEKVQEKTPAGTLALNLCSYFAPDEISPLLIRNASEFLPRQSSFLIRDSRNLKKGIEVLNQYSLVNAQADSFSIHRLVQKVVRDRLNAKEQKIWLEAAIQTIDTNFPSEGYIEPEVWPKCATLLYHANVVTDHAIANGVAMKVVSSLLNSVASYLHGRDSYSDAEVLYRQALEIDETLLGPVHADVAVSLNNLAVLLLDQDKYAEAEPLCRQALKIQEMLLGSNHPDVVDSLNNLASLLQDQNKYAEAESLYRRALENSEALMGGNHPDVASILRNLATLLRDQDKYAEAEPLYRRALKIDEKQLRADHPYVAATLCDLAFVLQAQEKYAEAEPLYRRVLKIIEARMGSDHPDVAFSLITLASLLQAQGKHAEAEVLSQRAQQIFNKYVDKC